MQSESKDLRHVILAGDADRLKILMRSADFDAELKTEREWTLLMLAASDGHAACIQLLLPVSNALHKAYGDITALMLAAVSKQPDCVHLLLPQSDAAASDSRGMNALMWAAYHGGEACVKKLLPVSLAQTCDHGGLTASDHARDRGYGALGDLIDAYTLSANETAALDDVTGPGAMKKSPVPRV